MVLKYGPFNGAENAWDAYDFAEFFKLFFGNGVFPNPSNNLQILAHENMQTKVSVGVGFVEGHKIKNTSDFILQHDIADGVLKRIDRVVMRANFLQNKGEIIVKRGNPASSPVAPTLVRNTDYYELALADVLINNGATVITQANITDQRLNTSLCGVVATNIAQLDTETLILQYQAAFEQMTIDQQQEFVEWVDSLKDILDENVAATLASRILSLENKTKIATTAQAQAGTDDTVLMTPLKVSEHLAPKGIMSLRTLSSSENIDALRTNGYYRLTNATFPSLNLLTGTYILEVYGDNGICMQKFTLINTAEINRTFVRYYNTANSTWFPLQEVSIGYLSNLQTTNKTNLVSAINEVKQYANDGKTAIANAVTAKGVAASPTDTFSTLATKIGQISTGKKTAMGTGTTDSSGRLTVNGLGFKPRNIIVQRLAYDSNTVIYSEDAYVYSSVPINKFAQSGTVDIHNVVTTNSSGFIATMQYFPDTSVAYFASE